MAEEHEHHGLSHGHDESGDKKEQKSAMYWSLGIAAAGLVVTVLFLSGSGQKKQPGTNTVVQESRPFIPNPSDVSIGSMAAPLYWPALPTSGTPHHPKTHHTGDTDDKKKKTQKSHNHTTPNDHKGYGKSPTGASHGHTVTVHTHNPKTVPQHTKGKLAS